MTLLVGGMSVRDTAAELGIGETTLYCWMQRPDFRAEFDRRLEEGRQAAIGHLRGNAQQFARTLVDVARSGGKEDGPRVKAAELGLALLGVVPTERMEVTHHGDLHDLSDEELQRRLDVLDARHQRPAASTQPN